MRRSVADIDSRGMRFIGKRLRPNLASSQFRARDRAYEHSDNDHAPSFGNRAGRPGRRLSRNPRPDHLQSASQYGYRYGFSASGRLSLADAVVEHYPG